MAVLLDRKAPPVASLHAGYEGLCGAFLIACQTRSGVSGISRSVTPRGARASSAALTSAAGEPIEPASPQPLAPSGLWVQGWLSSHSVIDDGRSSGRPSAAPMKQTL